MENRYQRLLLFFHPRLHITRNYNFFEMLNLIGIVDVVLDGDVMYGIGSTKEQRKSFLEQDREHVHAQ